MSDVFIKGLPKKRVFNHVTLSRDRLLVFHSVDIETELQLMELAIERGHNIDALRCCITCRTQTLLCEKARAKLVELLQ